MKTKLPDRLDVFEGDLYDNRKPWGPDPNKAENVVRKRYEYTFGKIDTRA